MAAIWRIPQVPAMRVPRSTGPANLVQVYYTPTFAPWRRDRDNMTPTNILYPKLMDSYENMPHDTLRWQVVGNTAVKEAPKAVMRERLRRRVREAFREALKQRGYDRNGKVLQASQGGGKALKDLKGTLEIHCRGRVGLDCEFGEIVKHSKVTVDAVAKSFNQGGGRLGNFRPGEEWWKPVATTYRPLYARAA